MQPQYHAAETGFNSRTREGATAGDVEKLEANIVSIHAPVKVRPHIRRAAPTKQQFQFTHP